MCGIPSFAAKYEVLLYELTSTYFESAPPEDPKDIRRFGYSRDKRPAKEVDPEKAAACSLEAMRTGGTCESCQ